MSTNIEKSEITEADAHLEFFDCMSKSQKKRNTPVIKLDDNSREPTLKERIQEKLEEDSEFLDRDSVHGGDDASNDMTFEKEESKDRFEFDYVKDFNKLLENMNFKEQEDVNEKKEILYHLMRDYGADNHGQWTIETPLHELKYELQKRKNAESEKDNIEFIKQIIVVVLHVIEFINKKVNILNLDGWATHVTQNLEKYHKSLRAIHLRYFRNHINDPITELGWMIIGSMVIFHIGQGKSNSNTSASTNTNTNSESSNQYSKPASQSSGFDISTVLNLLGKMA